MRRIIFLVMLISSYVFGYSLFKFYLPIYFRNLGAPFQLLGVLFSVLYLLSALGGMLWGRLCDIMGSRNVLLLICLTSFLTIFLLNFSNHWLLAFTLLLIYSFVWTGRSIATQVLTANLVPKEKLASGMSLIYLPPRIMPVIGPLIGGIVISFLGYSNLFIMASLLFLLSTSLSFFMPNIRFKGGEKGRGTYLSLIRDNREFRSYLLSILLAVNMPMSILGPYLTLYLLEIGMSESTIGFTFSLNSISALIMQVPGGVLLDKKFSRREDRLKALRFFITLSLLSSLIKIIIYLASNPFLVFIAYASSGIIDGLTTGPSLSYQIEILSKDTVGMGIGLLRSASDTTTILGQLLGSLLLHVTKSIKELFPISIIFSIIGLIIYIKGGNKNNISSQSNGDNSLCNT